MGLIELLGALGCSGLCGVLLGRAVTLRGVKWGVMCLAVVCLLVGALLSRLALITLGVV